MEKVDVLCISLSKLDITVCVYNIIYASVSSTLICFNVC